MIGLRGAIFLSALSHHSFFIGIWARRAPASRQADKTKERRKAIIIVVAFNCCRGTIPSHC